MPEMDSGAYQPRRPRRPEACARAEGPVRLVVCKAPFSARAESQEQNTTAGSGNPASELHASERVYYYDQAPINFRTNKKEILMTGLSAVCVLFVSFLN